MSCNTGNLCHKVNVFVLGHCVKPSQQPSSEDPWLFASCKAIYYIICIAIMQEKIPLEDLAALEKDYEEVGIETAEGEGEEEGYGDEF